MIKRAIGSKGETSASATGIAYERRNRRADVDGVQRALGADSIKHARARLEAQIADTDRRSVVVDRADRGDQGAVIWVDLDERARPGGRGKEAAVWMEGNPA
jgi:hypothetical protein